MCDAHGVPSAVLADVKASSLRISGGELVFVDDAGAAPGLANPRAIRRLRPDGTGDAVVYSAPPNTRLSNLVADAVNVYFVQTEQVNGSEKAFLYTVATTGATPRRVSPSSAGYNHEAEVFAVDDQSIYVGQAGAIARVSQSDGSEVVIAKPSGQPTDSQLLDGVVYYALAHGQSGIFKVPADAATVSDSRIGDIRCGPYAVSVTPAGIFCGLPGGVVRFDLDGTNEKTVIDGLSLGDPSLAPSLPDGDAIYIQGQGGLTAPATLYRLSIATGAAVPVACDRGYIADIRFTGPDVFWLETRESAATRVTGIYRLRK